MLLKITFYIIDVILLQKLILPAHTHIYRAIVLDKISETSMFNFLSDIRIAKRKIVLFLIYNLTFDISCC